MLFSSIYLLNSDMISGITKGLLKFAVPIAIPVAPAMINSKTSFIVAIPPIPITGILTASLTVMINDDGTLKVDYSDDDDYYTFHCVKSDSE